MVGYFAAQEKQHKTLDLVTLSFSITLKYPAMTNMKYLITLLIALFSNKSFTQGIFYGSIYKDLPILRMDAMFMRTAFAVQHGPGETKYLFNGNAISKSEYDYYTNSFEANNIGKCRPCYLKLYDKNILLEEAERSTDCLIGIRKTYFPNGAIQSIAHYRQNMPGDWINGTPKYCSVRTGKWTYFKQGGDTLYHEFWENNEFIKQVPEQDSAEIWSTLVLLRGIEIPADTLLQKDELRQLIIKPLLKNKSTRGIQLKIVFEIKMVDKKINRFEGSLAAFKNINIDKMLSESEIQPGDNFTCGLFIYNTNTVLRYFPFKIKG
ncbi:MAG: hypothetical protein V4722_08415 [Bacteroidota bacterium]